MNYFLLNDGFLKSLFLLIFICLKTEKNEMFVRIKFLIKLKKCTLHFCHSSREYLSILKVFFFFFLPVFPLHTVQTCRRPSNLPSSSSTDTCYAVYVVYHSSTRCPQLKYYLHRFGFKDSPGTELFPLGEKNAAGKVKLCHCHCQACF